MVSCFERQTRIVREQISGKFFYDIRNVRQMINVGFYFRIIFLTYTACVPYFVKLEELKGRSHWSRSLRRRSAAARLLRSWVRIPPGAWIFVCCECCVLSGRGLCDELITRPEESYRLCCVVVCDLETSRMRRP